MRLALLDLLRCPFCGGRLAFVESAFHRWQDDELSDGLLGCHCCAFPVVAGIPVLHLEAASNAARESLDRGEPDRAFHTLMGLEDEDAAKTFDSVRDTRDATYRELVTLLGPNFERGYFLYRFSDPTYLVAQAVVTAVGRVCLEQNGTAVDVCGGSGHLTRTLASLTKEPVLADLYFAKLWLAKRFIAPSCQPVCCDGNAPLPFATDAFRVAVCSDAFHYIWTKRLLASEMIRIVAPDGAVALTHVHNALQWNPSAGTTLPPEGYVDLFAEAHPRLFSERMLLEGVVEGVLHLERRHTPAELAADPALTLLASARPEIFDAHLALVGAPQGRFRLNPLYHVTTDGSALQLELRFPSADYEDEYGAARLYLPEALSLSPSLLEELALGKRPPEAAELIRRRVILDVPSGYF